MNKLFTKFSIAIASVFASFYASACTEPNRDITGTAEERNQTAQSGHSTADGNMPELVEPDSVIETTTQAGNSRDKDSSLPQTVIPSPIQVDPRSSSSTSPKGNADGAYSSAKIEFPMSEEGRSGGFGGGVVGASSSSSTTSEPNIAGHVEENLLSVYVKKTGINGISFDGAVYGINKTYQSCDLSTSACSETEPIDEYRTVGLHKVALEKIEKIAEIFPMTYATLPIDQIKISYTDECALYVLNVNDTSPVWRVLTKVSADSIVVQEIFDKCDYEARPFKVHVGFLFSYCRELGSSTKIVQEGVPNGDVNCSEVSYEEYSK